MLRWVVFDYGEVISVRTRALPELAAMLGTDPESFETAYFAERVAYDRGGTDTDYWRAVGAHFDVEVDDTRVEALTGTDTEGWLDTDTETLRLIDELVDAGVTLALLSNAPSTFARVAEQQPWARNFEHLVFSGDLRLGKPDAAIYLHLLDTIAARPKDCLFFDDRRENIDAAREAGLHAETWTGAEAARRKLRELGVLG
ncbi:HAD family hydrolase [Saccharopolyspora erythraea]|uniref:HAD-superfamily hydrolase subfamily IA, variant 3 n=2 Tax=Saccharopolyspora erythraea TaxID=1836 RepID=A4FQJ6_SACEN|nr:HAD family phosphatase [Saccharopolyspora erythraea]QRK94040.1 HAD family phosphatase [Saccharopolyspora erythraea]CAM06321.1 HAD-superfamily hydrolase subfamily IA, variant 3 [Saccharopolyspora erythraea NRRL 2338]